MDNNLKGFVSGFAGAITLTAIHQWLKNNVKDAPRIDILGVQAIESILKKINIDKPSKKTLYNLSLAGDILFNSFYYRSVAKGKKPLLKGALLGSGAGSSVLTLPGAFNLNENLSTRNFTQGLLSFGIYFIGGLVAAGVYKAIEDI